VVGDASLSAKKAEQSNRHTRTFSSATHLADNMYLV